MTLPARFWAKVDTTAGLLECWPWIGGRTTSGYGHFWVNGRHEQATRLSYEDSRGAIGDGLELDHTCRVRACVNPAHLEPVTHRENCLRGASPMAAYMRSNRCKRGHRLIAPNLIRLTNRATRACLTCHNWREGERKRRKRLALGLPRLFLGGGRTSRLAGVNAWTTLGIEAEDINVVAVAL